MHASKLSMVNITYNETEAFAVVTKEERKTKLHCDLERYASQFYLKHHLNKSQH